MIFDAHTHFFGREFYQFQAGLVAGADPDEVIARIRTAGVDVPEGDPRAHAQRWIAEMDRYKVDRAALFASVPTEMSVVGEMAAELPDRFVPFAMVDPRRPETVTTLDQLQPQYGFRGMLLFPSMNEYSIQSPEATAALEVAMAHRMVVFVHCGRLRITVRKLIGLDPDFAPQKSRPRDLLPVAQAHPDLAFIVPHFGAGYFDELLTVAESCTNVYTDTAGSNAWIVEHDPPLSLSEVFKDARESFGVDRILFGSDSGTFPRGYRSDILEKQKEAMRNAGFSDRDQAAVLGGNLSRLLGD